MPYPENFGINWQPTQTQTYPQPSTPIAQTPRYQVAQVEGEQGALDFPMGPNSSIFLADKTNRNRIWLCMTDEMGYKKVRPIDCKFADDEEVGDFAKRLKRLEDIVNERLVNTRGSKPKSTSTESES